MNESKQILLPCVDFCGLNVTRLVIGANPFAGFSHQGRERDEAMQAYYTVDRIQETWRRAQAAGINTMITNNTTLHLIEALREYLGKGGCLQWIAQVSCRKAADMSAAIDEVMGIGCKAIYFHGALIDDVYLRKDDETMRKWCAYVRSCGVPVGVAGHTPEAHLWVDSLHITDFHALCFFNCGSLHDGKGERFRLNDIGPAIECIRRIKKPCIGYKIMGAGRIDPHMAFEYAFAGIKKNDVVSVGMYRGDQDDMVEQNAAIVRKLLGRSGPEGKRM